MNSILEQLVEFLDFIETETCPLVHNKYQEDTNSYSNIATFHVDTNHVE